MDKKMKKMVLISLFGFLLGISSSANAGKVVFGTQDSIHFVANTTIPGPNGSHLFIGHRVTMKAFLLPYYVESNGLVFGVSGESKKYIPLPPQEQLSRLQNEGFLPNELPKAELSLFDYLMGFSLELFVFGSIGYAFIKNKFSARRS
jgi:hypothetical protein